ncbi:MAG: alpha/beta hydrolase [Burkholderiaceae bacterium]
MTTDELNPPIGDQLWLELPPHRGGKPNRLLVFLHGAGSSPEMFAPVALAWQFKFPNATAVVMEGLMPGSLGSGKDWFDPRAGQQSAELAAQAARQVARRIEAAQSALNLTADQTMVVGFSQGASVALELARLDQPGCHMIISYAGRLVRPITPGTPLTPTIHLLHGEFDTHVLAQQSLRAYRSLRDAKATVSLDVITDGVHSIGQDMINVGTTRAMQTIFQSRKAITVQQFHTALAVSMDSREDALGGEALH